MITIIMTAIVVRVTVAAVQQQQKHRQIALSFSAPTVCTGESEQNLDLS